MANTDAPFGVLPLGLNNSAVTPSFGLKKFIVDKDDTKVIARGDPCVKLATGYVERIASAPNTQGAHLYAGIFWGCSYLSIAQGRKVESAFWPGSDAAADVEALLVPLIGSPPGLFMVQSDGTAITFADIGLNAQVNYAAPTSQGVFRRSGVTLDQGSINTTATFPFKIEGLYSDIVPSGQNGADDTTDYNIVLVSFNAQQATGI